MSKIYLSEVIIWLSITDSPYRQPLSESVLQLQEGGKLTRMKNKWWKEKRGGGACPVSNTTFIFANL